MSYKFFSTNDIQSAKESLSEFIPVTGTILSGAFGTWPNDDNIKKYTATHGLFESVYDYPYLSSSANHIFDITIGVKSGSFTVVSGATNKHRIYTQMAQSLLGFDVTGNVKNFTVGATSTVISSAIFIPMSRLLIKDEISKASVQIIHGTSSFGSPLAGTRTLTDSGATVDTVYSDSPVGEYYYLTSGGTTYGTVFYQAGVVVLNADTINTTNWISSSQMAATGTTAQGFSSASITEVADSFRRLVSNIQFNNSTQLYSTIYNCRVDANEFNYSSNPTYLTGSKIRVKNNPTDKNYSYITTVGLYSDSDELLAVAKLSEPLRNTDAVNYTLSVRLDY